MTYYSDPPDEIDNNPIATAIDGRLVVKKSECLLKASEFAHFKYGIERQVLASIKTD